jgi:hypothetical protein
LWMGLVAFGEWAMARERARHAVPLLKIRSDVASLLICRAED